MKAKSIKKVWIGSWFRAAVIVYLAEPQYHHFNFDRGGWWSAPRDSYDIALVPVDKIRDMHFEELPMDLLAEYDITGSIPKLICVWLPDNCKMPDGWEYVS